eukprot:14075661-Alexandrium_andersonii.AAC.1
MKVKDVLKATGNAYPVQLIAAVSTPALVALAEWDGLDTWPGQLTPLDNCPKHLDIKEIVLR